MTTTEDFGDIRGPGADDAPATAASVLKHRREITTSGTVRRHWSLLAVVVAVVVAGCGGDTTEAAPPRHTTLPPAPPTTLVAPVATTTPQAVAGNASIDYRAAGTKQAQIDTALGTVTWLSTKKVPGDWILGGFPQPGYTNRELLPIYAQAPCCVEIYATDGGYLGVAADVNTDIWRDWFPQWYYWLYPTEVWFSLDGEQWELMSDEAFGEGAAVMRDPSVVAEHERRWIVIGWADVTVEKGEEPDGPGRGVPMAATPAAWVSDDLHNWTRLPVEFAVEGMHTRLTSVAAGEQGWVIFGVRASQESPMTAEWAGWVSPDGIEWEPLPINDIFLEPGCKPTPREFCNRVKATITDDAIVAYTHEWDPPNWLLVDTRWNLMIGVFDTPGRSD